MFERETNMVKLWIPEESDFARNNEWLWANHPPDVRYVRDTVCAPATDRHTMADTLHFGMLSFSSWATFSVFI